MNSWNKEITVINNLDYTTFITVLAAVETHPQAKNINNAYFLKSRL